MARVRDKIYQPDAAAKAIYDELYGQYSRLHDLFGRDGQGTMKVLKQLRAAVFSAAKSIPA
jgi:L-ribulokinase